MTRFRSLNPILFAIASLIAWACGSGCSADHGSPGDGAVWFVHATDPHIYLELKNPTEESIWTEQQKLDGEAFQLFVREVGTLPQIPGPPAFLLVTGDFGVDPCLHLNAATIELAKKDPTNFTAKTCLGGFDPKDRTKRVENLAELLAASPVRDIYFVAGNNDLPRETADDAGLAYFSQFFADVQKIITDEKKSKVLLHNLTGCYAPTSGATSPCAEDVPGAPSYRLIGFPSYSFKNKDTDYDKNRSLQSAQFKMFRALFDQSLKEGRKVLIVTHIPEMDDPYFLARERYAGVKPAPSADEDKSNLRSSNSTWNVEKSLLDDWTKVLASDSVIAVLAGHLHDGHRELYQRPYSWSTAQDHQMGFRKLFLAPPLSVKNQDNSPIQARGFSVVTLKSDHVDSRLYWYDGKTKQFNPEPRPKFVRPPQPRWLTRAFGGFNWMWELDHSDGPLQRSAVLLIALLAGFLTVIAVWQIPPSENPLTKKPADDKKPDDKDTSKAVPEPSPFTTKFGKTVIAGLGGLIFTEIAKMIGNRKPSDDANYFYLVCFIVFFFLLLIFFSASRAFAEAIRSRIAVMYYPLARRPHIPRTVRGASSGSLLLVWAARWFWRIADWLGYWILRIVNWAFSLKVPALTFFDTFINLIQGKNQTTTRALEEVVIDQQKNLIRVADAIRKNLNNLIESKVGNRQPNESNVANQRDRGTLPHVRVNISVLSADQSSVFYVSRAPGSSLCPFTKRSVAWVSVFTGQIRWWSVKLDERAGKITLFDNRKGVIADAEDEIMLSTYFQDRSGDYGGFVVIPLPWPQRSYGSKYVKGAIHISFREPDDIYAIWDEEKINPPDPEEKEEKESPWAYPTPHRMLEKWCTDTEVRSALQNSVVALGELLFGFNEIIYKNYIEPDQKD